VPAYTQQQYSSWTQRETIVEELARTWIEISMYLTPGETAGDHPQMLILDKQVEITILV
jgi:hypothetical protein